MGLDLNIDVDTRSFDTTTRRFARKAKNMTRVMRELKPLLKQDQQINTRMRIGPDNTRFDRRSAATRARNRWKRKGKRQRKGPMVDFRRLSGALQLGYGRDFVVARSRVPWSSVHQTGGRVGNGTVLPERPYLYVSEKLQRIAAAKIKRHIRRSWG